MSAISKLSSLESPTTHVQLPSLQDYHVLPARQIIWVRYRHAVRLPAAYSFPAARHHREPFFSHFLSCPANVAAAAWLVLLRGWVGWFPSSE